MVKGVEMQLLLDFQHGLTKCEVELVRAAVKVQFPVQGVCSVRFSDFGVHGRE